MDDVFGVPVSVGTISQLEQATTEAVAAPVEEALAYVPEQDEGLAGQYRPGGPAHLPVSRDYPGLWDDHQSPDPLDVRRRDHERHRL